MELNIIESDKNKLKVEIKGEGHTLTNDLREELAKDKNVSAVGYSVENRLLSSPVLLVKGSDPKKSLEKAIDSMRARNDQLKKLFEKI